LGALYSEEKKGSSPGYKLFNETNLPPGVLKRGPTKCRKKRGGPNPPGEA